VFSGANAGGVAAKIDEGSGGGDWRRPSPACLRKANGLAETQPEVNLD
jgi:hypothetical protein